ncbi:MAG: hypothetical protein NC398_07115 [Acetatifactor muris]|nr:hypothetical protein [Acetatifactor muris]MCM1525707.1 hypothetical protein [Bacteroides sp.]
MSLKVVIFQREENYIRKFLSCPDILYTKYERTQDKKTERALLTGTHCLSNDAEVWGALVLTEKGEALARCAITYYEGDDRGFFGFFECCKNQEVCHRLMEAVKRHAAQQGKKTLVGPVDASFWIGYRFKTDHFDRPYTAEPYNKEYYPALLEAEGFTVWEEYCSNRYRLIEPDYTNAKAQERMQKRFREGYVVRSPKRREFRRCLKEIYHLIVELYKDFPAYKPIAEKQFLKMFGKLKHVLVWDMVKLAYKDGKTVGFFVTVPNYGNLLSGSVTPVRLAQILHIRRKPKEYILLYLGADREHLGVGSLLATCIQEELQKRQCRSVGALIQKGKVTGSYFADLVEDTCRYVLLTTPL